MTSTLSTTIILCILFCFRKTSLILTSGKVVDALVDLADQLFNHNMLFFKKNLDN